MSSSSRPENRKPLLQNNLDGAFAMPFGQCAPPAADGYHPVAGRHEYGQCDRLRHPARAQSARVKGGAALLAPAVLKVLMGHPRCNIPVRKRFGRLRAIGVHSPAAGRAVIFPPWIIAMQGRLNRPTISPNPGTI